MYRSAPLNLIGALFCLNFDAIHFDGRAENGRVGTVMARIALVVAPLVFVHLLI